jgi:hypothetical protein
MSQQPEKLSWRLRVRVLMETALGLSYLHENNVVHRDVKPGTVLCRVVSCRDGQHVVPFHLAFDFLLQLPFHLPSPFPFHVLFHRMVIVCRAVPCRAILCRAVLCRAVLCRAVVAVAVAAAAAVVVVAVSSSSLSWRCDSQVA